MTDVRTSQGDVTVVSVSGGGDMRLTQGDVTVVYNLPAEFMQTSSGDLSYVAQRSVDGQVSQADVTVIMRGRTDDPAVRAWTFTLDGHDFYVLRLGTVETLVYDMTTDTWYQWGSGNSILWNAYTGINWTSGNNFSDQFGSNILVGSDSNGTLFFLDPDKVDDDTAVTGRDPVPFTRRATGQLAYRGYESVSVYSVHLVGSVGKVNDPAYTTITLSYSDDRGTTYTDAGSVVTSDGDFTVRAQWQSLGSFSNPGRLFRLEDTGALQRVDSLTVSSDLDNAS